MKKGKVLIAILLSFTLITAHCISGTFARYTSGMSTTDQARVARWGLNVDNEVDLFSESVIKGLNGESTNEDNIIAPGTSGEYTFVISGTAETAYKVDIDVEVEDFTNGRIHYYLDNQDLGYGEDGIQLFTSILESMLSNGKVYAPGCDLFNAGDGEHTIGWKWEYEEVDTDGNLYDAVDTNLGNKTGAYLKENDVDTTTPSSEVPGLKLTVSITAEQVVNPTVGYAAW